MQRRHYTEEEKNAVMSRYAAGGEEVKSMLAEYGIPKSTFNQWLREYDLRYGCESKYDFTPRNFRSILRRNDHLEDLLAVLKDSFCSPNAPLRERLDEAEAYNDRAPGDGLAFHSDRGPNYKAESFRILLASKNVTQSFSRAYVPYDNAVMESFFGSMKKEELYRWRYRSERELKERIKEFVAFYNNIRPHEKLRYKTPVQVDMHGKMNLPSCGKEFFLQPVSRFFFVR